MIKINRKVAKGLRQNVLPRLNIIRIIDYINFMVKGSRKRLGSQRVKAPTSKVGFSQEHPGSIPGPGAYIFLGIEK